MSQTYPNNWWRWILCCYCCERDKCNKLGDSYYDYGKTYTWKKLKKRNKW